MRPWTGTRDLQSLIARPSDASSGSFAEETSTNLECTAEENSRWMDGCTTLECTAEETSSHLECTAVSAEEDECTGAASTELDQDGHHGVSYEKVLLLTLRQRH